MKRLLLIALFCAFSGTVLGNDPSGTIQLPDPQVTGGKTLNEALLNRKSTRAFSSKKLDLQTLSNLLWSAQGVNRNDGRRTAPSALNSQETSLYLILEEGVYCYDAFKNQLVLIAEGDHRDLAGTQEYTHSAPVTVIYVADFAKLKIESKEDRIRYASADVGFIGQNIYLFVANNGLAAVFRASLDRPALVKCLKLNDKQEVLFAQSIGYPQQQ